MLGVAVVLAVACAIPLRNIADVRPEITRVVATEERTAATYQAASDAFRKGRISAEALAQLAERKILPELQAVDARLTALRNVPSEHQPLVTDAREYLRLRSKAWRVGPKRFARPTRIRCAGRSDPWTQARAFRHRRGSDRTRWRWGTRKAPSGRRSKRFSASRADGAPRTGARRGTLKHLRHPPYLRRSIIAA